jgi:hypothetical protein
MGFAAVARVTEQRFCCAVRDEIEFGLVPGGELEVETTLCHEIRQSHEAVVIDNVAEDAAYCGHHTPALTDNVLDFARGRLGSGIALKRSPQSLQPVLDRVIAELRAGSPERNIVRSDAGRFKIGLAAKFQKNLPGNRAGALTP